MSKGKTKVTHKVVFWVGDCEFNSKMEIECSCFDAADNIKTALIYNGLDVLDVEIEEI